MIDSTDTTTRGVPTAKSVDRIGVSLEVAAAVAGVCAPLWPVVGGFSAFVLVISGLLVRRYATRLRDQEFNVAVERETAELKHQVRVLDPAHRPRKLTPEQHNHLVLNLRRGPKGPVEVRSAKFWVDGETFDFMMSLHEALETAGWPVNKEACRAAENCDQQVGLYIRAYSQSGRAPAHAKYLKTYIEFLGIPVYADVDSTKDDERIELIVGIRQLY